MGCICYDWNTNYSPSHKSCMSISRDPSKNQFSLQMSSVTPGNKAVFKEQSCETLNKRHSEGTSMWSLTQMSHAGILMTDTWWSAQSKLIYSPNGLHRHAHSLFLLKFWFLPSSSFQTPPCTMILQSFLYEIIKNISSFVDGHLWIIFIWKAENVVIFKI
jgi:hypothetical protein